LPRFTAVLPLYNKAGTINRAIGSVLAQSATDCEIIVVDDGSTDGSVEAIDKGYLPRIKLVRQANAGPGRARNVGAALAEGEFLAFLDADDEWEPGFLAAAGEALSRHDHCAAYVSAYSSGSMQHVQEEILLRLIPHSGPRTIDGFKKPSDIKNYVDCFHSSSTVVRREVFQRCGGYFERDRCLYGEDSYFWLQIALMGHVFFDRAKNARFHVEDSSLGIKQKGRHPRRPAIVDPAPLRKNCPPARQPILEALLAFYRLVETEKLVAQGKFRDVPGLRQSFPWPSGAVDLKIAAREARVSALGFINRGRFLVSSARDDATISTP
jgi:glycosyltransferase involved in cell wall biosynthesis